MKLSPLNSTVCASLVIVALVPQVALNQTGTRDIILKEFQAERHLSEKPAKLIPKRIGNSILGITLWKMRPATVSDSGAVKFRGLIHPEQPDNNAEWTAERVSLDSIMTAGQLVRISIESAQRGYLYVIDRDIFADGSTGPPNLIFPTLRLRSGDNRVQPGAPIEIPDGQDRPPVFQLEKTRADQVSILLTIIVAPQRIAEIRPGPGLQELTNEQVIAWEKRWSRQSERVENSASAGKVYTPAEQAAAQVNPRRLGPNDPLPLTLIQAKPNPGQPMFVSIPIKMQ